MGGVIEWMKWMVEEWVNLLVNESVNEEWMVVCWYNGTCGCLSVPGSASPDPGNTMCNSSTGNVQHVTNNSISPVLVTSDTLGWALVAGGDVDRSSDDTDRMGDNCCCCCCEFVNGDCGISSPCNAAMMEPSLTTCWDESDSHLCLDYSVTLYSTRTTPVLLY